MSNTRLGRLAVASGLLAALVVASSDQPAQAQKDKGRKSTFEVYKDKGGEFRWRLKAGNDKIIAVPEDAYKSHTTVKNAIDSIKTNLAKMKVEYYEDKKKEHRWRLKATNGQVMARSSEGYKGKEGAEKAIALFKEGVKTAAVAEKK